MCEWSIVKESLGCTCFELLNDKKKNYERVSEGGLDKD